MSTHSAALLGSAWSGAARSPCPPNCAHTTVPSGQHGWRAQGQAQTRDLCQITLLWGSNLQPVHSSPLPASLPKCARPQMALTKGLRAAQPAPPHPCPRRGSALPEGSLPLGGQDQQSPPGQKHFSSFVARDDSTLAEAFPSHRFCSWPQTEHARGEHQGFSGCVVANRGGCRDSLGARAQSGGGGRDCPRRQC